MPCSCSAAPRKMLPPPTTMAIWTPPSLTSATSAAIRPTVTGSMPNGSPPANDSPDSFRSTLRPPQGVRSLVEELWPCRCSLRCGLSSGRPCSGRTARTSIFSPSEALGVVEQRLDGLLVVLDPGLLEQAEVLVEAVDPALDDLLERGLGLALLAGGWSSKTLRSRPRSPRARRRPCSRRADWPPRCAGRGPWPSCWNCSVLATKSVSQLSSRSTPTSAAGRAGLVQVRARGRCWPPALALADALAALDAQRPRPPCRSRRRPPRAPSCSPSCRRRLPRGAS